MKKIILILICFLIVGCSVLMPEMPGRMTDWVSGFDGSKNISVEPAWVWGDKGVRLGLQKNSTEEKAVLTVIVVSGYNFSEKDSVQFNVDGEILSVDPINDVTEVTQRDGRYLEQVGYYINSAKLSSKKFWIAKDIVRRLIDGKKVGVRVSLASGEIFDGDFSKEYPYGVGAKPAFKKFYEKVWGGDETAGKK